MEKKIYNQPEVETAQVSSASIILSGSIHPGPPVTPEDPIQDGD